MAAKISELSEYTGTLASDDVIIIVRRADLTMGVNGTNVRVPWSAVLSNIGIERRHDWVSPYSYDATAPLGSLNSEAVWTIARIEVAGDGSTTVLHAVDVAWDDRLTATYS